MNAVYPVPRKQRVQKTKLSLNKLSEINYSSALSGYIKTQIKDFGSRLSDHIRARSSKNVPNSAVGINFRKSAKLRNQSYAITISKDRINVDYADPAACLYALQTLQQICADKKTVHLQEIEDSPDSPIRGYMLDISRCKVPKLETIFKLIDILSDFRINQLQFYTEHTYAFKDHKKVWKNASPLSANEIRKIEKYCSEREIELVPNFNSFGHWERWLRHPEYKDYAECPDGFFHEIHQVHKDHGTTLVPQQKSLKLLETLYDEYLANFNSRLFNVGCDETWELGQGRSKSRAEKIGKTRVYLEFIKKIHRQVNKRHRTMMFWGDIILREPKLIKELPKNIIALNWGYESNHPFSIECEQFKKAKVPYYVCPGTSAWNSLVGRFTNAQKNLISAAKNGLKHNAAGYLITDWGDFGHHQTLPISYPGIAAGACYSWNLKRNKNIDIAEILNKKIFKDSKGQTGKLLIEIGKLTDLYRGKIHNNSVFNLLLFEQAELKVLRSKIKAKVSTKLLHELRRNIKRLNTKIKNCKPNCEDRTIIIDELKHSLNLALLSVDKELNLRNNRVSTDLKTDLKKAVRDHQRIWKLRNRSGGLAESTDALKKLL